MADFTKRTIADMAVSRPDINSGTSADTRLMNWASEELYWEENYASRPYVKADRSFEHYRPAYRYGAESRARYEGRHWSDVEPELRGGWDRYEHRGNDRSTWEEVKDAVRDAWDRVTGR